MRRTTTDSNNELYMFFFFCLIPQPLYKWIKYWNIIIGFAYKRLHIRLLNTAIIFTWYIYFQALTRCIYLLQVKWRFYSLSREKDHWKNERRKDETVCFYWLVKKLGSWQILMIFFNIMVFSFRIQTNFKLGSWCQSCYMCMLLCFLGGWKTLMDSVSKFGADSPLTKLVVTFKDADPDDAFSSVPYEKGSCFLFYLEQLVGGPGRNAE